MLPMTICLAEIWIPKDGIEKECFKVSRKILEYIKSHRDEFKGRNGDNPIDYSMYSLEIRNGL